MEKHSPKFPFDHLNTVGARLRSFRGFLGYSRKDMETFFEVKEVTLKAWEMDHVKSIYPKSIQKLVQNFQKAGMPVTHEWVVHGEGPSPFDRNRRTLDVNTPAQEIMAQEAQYFQDIGHDRVIFPLKDDTFAPHYTAGDVIGGTRINIENINDHVGQPCIVLRGTQDKMCGTLVKGPVKDPSNTSEKNQFSLLTGPSSQESTILLTEYDSIYKVIWWRKNL